MTTYPVRKFLHRHAVRNAVAKELKPFLISRVHRKTVKLQEDLAADPGNPFIAINKWLVLC